MRTTPIGIAMLNDERKHVWERNNPLNMEVVQSWANVVREGLKNEDGTAPEVVVGSEIITSTRIAQKVGDELTRAGCWAHARRKYYDVRRDDRPRCSRMLKLIQDLFAIERKAKELRADRSQASAMSSTWRCAGKSRRHWSTRSRSAPRPGRWRSCRAVRLAKRSRTCGTSGPRLLGS